MSQSATNTATEEPLKDVIIRKSINSWLTTKSFCRKSDRNMRIAVKKAQLYQAKSEFGVEYMGKVESSSADEDLDACVKSGWDRVDALNGRIEALRDDKARIDMKLRSKLRVSPTAAPEGAVETPTVAVIQA